MAWPVCATCCKSNGCLQKPGPFPADTSLIPAKLSQGDRNPYGFRQNCPVAVGDGLVFPKSIPFRSETNLFWKNVSHSNRERYCFRQNCPVPFGNELVFAETGLIQPDSEQFFRKQVGGDLSASGSEASSPDSVVRREGWRGTHPNYGLVKRVGGDRFAPCSLG